MRIRFAEEFTLFLYKYIYTSNRENNWEYTKGSKLQNKFQNLKLYCKMEPNPESLQGHFPFPLQCKKEATHQQIFWQPVRALSIPPKSKQVIYKTSIDRKGTRIMFYFQNHDRAVATNAKYAHGVIYLNVSSENLTRNQGNDARTQIFNNRPFLIYTCIQ